MRAACTSDGVYSLLGIRQAVLLHFVTSLFNSNCNKIDN